MALIKCPKCGMSLNDDCIVVWKCNECGKAFKLNLAKLNKIQELKKQKRDKYLLKCSACENPLDDGNEKIVCKCLSCGNVIGGNLDYLASEAESFKVAAKAPDSVMVVCPKCGVEVLTGAKFCNKCGCSLNESIAKKESKKKIIFITVFTIIVISVVSGLYFKEEQRKEEQRLNVEIKEKERQELITEYLMLGQKLYDEIVSTSSDFNILSTMFDTSANLNTGLLGPAFFTDYVRGLCSDNIMNAKNIKITIDRIKSEIDGLECDEPEVQELSVAIEDLYSAYIERYDLLVEGNFSVNNFHNLDETSKKNFDEKLTVVNQIISLSDLENEEE